MNYEDQEPIRPYIGITGFMTNEEVIDILNLFPISSKRLLMVGVLASWKTLYENKASNRYPNIDNIAKIFPSHLLALNLIHYNTKNTENLCEQLVLLSRLGGKNLHGFQLNMTWPPTYELYKFRSKYPDHIIVLVITAQALNETNSPNVLVSKIEDYKGLVDYVLLDQSEGYGIPLDTELMQKCIDVLKLNRSMGIVVAGGLSSKTLNLVEPLIKNFPDLSIDAEDRLRDDNDLLNLNLARDYVCRALQMFGEVE